MLVFSIGSISTCCESVEATKDEMKGIVDIAPIRVCGLASTSFSSSKIVCWFAATSYIVTSYWSSMKIVCYLSRCNSSLVMGF